MDRLIERSMFSSGVYICSYVNAAYDCRGGLLLSRPRVPLQFTADACKLLDGHRRKDSHATMIARAPNVFDICADQQCTDVAARQGGDAGPTRVWLFCAAPNRAAMTAVCASCSAKMVCLLWGSLMR